MKKIYLLRKLLFVIVFCVSIFVLSGCNNNATSTETPVPSTYIAVYNNNMYESKVTVNETGKTARINSLFLVDYTNKLDGKYYDSYYVTSGSKSDFAFTYSQTAKTFNFQTELDYEYFGSESKTGISIFKFYGGFLEAKGVGLTMNFYYDKDYPSKLDGMVLYKES